MLKLSFDDPHFLFLGAHSDDIEIGCGATILRMLEVYPAAHVMWIVFTGDKKRQEEAFASGMHFLQSLPENQKIIKVNAYEYLYGGYSPIGVNAGFTDGILNVNLLGIKATFEKIKSSFTPSVIFTHYRHDLHQDHRLISEVTYQTFRHHLILEYEIPKVDGDLGNPNVFVPVDRVLVDAKIDALEKYFGSQRSRSWFTPEVFEAMLVLRGINAASPTGYAEGFYCRRMILA